MRDEYSAMFDSSITAQTGSRIRLVLSSPITNIIENIVMKDGFEFLVLLFSY